jgi:hypothetical protein
MQPENPYVSPSPSPAPPPPPVSAPLPPQPQPVNGAPQPDYSFLNQQPKRSFKLPFSTSSFTKKVIVIAVIAILLIILLIIGKGIISPAPFSKTDYLLVAERQQEMIHILTTDITQSNLSQLTTADQNFVATATVALGTAQVKTLAFMAVYKDKVKTANLAKIFDSSIDSALSAAQSSNNLDGAFKSEMQEQFNYYESDLKTAYNSTRISNGRLLISNEYSEVKLLITALGASS